MPKVTLEKDGRIARITLNRPDVMNAIDDDLPIELSAAVTKADADHNIHVMLLSENGPAFCAGYNLKYYAEQTGDTGNQVTQNMPWDPMVDYAFLWWNTQHFMSLWRAKKSVICKIHQTVEERDTGSYDRSGDRPLIDDD